MKVLLDARETRRMSVGMRLYVHELANRLPRVAPDIQLTKIERGAHFSFIEQVEIPFAARDADLVHFPTIFAPVVLPRRYVLTIHDLIHLRFPHLFSRTTGVYYSVFVGRLARGAARVLVGDERTIDDCERFLGVARERIRVVRLGYDESLLDVPPFAPIRPYVIYAGNHRPHKNLATLIAAWRSLPADVDLDLYLTGADDLNVGPGHSVRRLVFLGDLPARELAARIRGAHALVQPSLAEGFGLPVLEALVRSVPVIATEASAPQPLAPFAASFEARDVGALRSLLEEVVRAPTRLRRLAAEGESIARAYTWDRFATQTASVYRDALEGPPHP